MMHRQDEQVLTITERPTLKKFWHLVPLVSPRGHETGSSSNGTNSGQLSPIDPVIGPILIDASGILLDLSRALGY
jgi:hypothetical protein